MYTHDSTARLITTLKDIVFERQTLNNKNDYQMFSDENIILGIINQSGKLYLELEYNAKSCYLWNTIIIRERVLKKSLFLE